MDFLKYILGLFVLGSISTSAPGFKVNGKELATYFSQVEDTLIITLNNKNFSTLRFTLTPENLEIGAYNWISKTMEDNYKKLEAAQDKLNQFAITNIQSKNVSFKGVYYKAADKGTITASEKLLLNSTILEAQELLLATTNIDTTNCYLKNVKKVYLTTSSNDSYIQEIIITLAEDIKVHFFQLGLDFSKNTTNDDNIIVGVEKVEIKFAPHAYTSDKAEQGA